MKFKKNELMKFYDDYYSNVFEPKNYWSFPSEEYSWYIMKNNKA